MKDLPIDIWKCIFKLLPYDDLLNMKKTSKFFQPCLTKELLNEKLYERDTATIAVGELIFYEGDDDEWRVFPEIPKRGTVGSFGQDRCPDWNLFVVIKADVNKMEIIHPRIRINPEGRILLGIDKLAENWYGGKHKCVCQFIGGDGCRCGSYDKNIKEYQKTFKEAKCRYKIKKWQDSLPFIFRKFLKKSSVNNVDVSYY